MGGFKQPDFAERTSAAADARKANLEKIKANLAANAELLAKKQAERAEIARQREQRQAQRAAEKAERERLEAEAEAARLLAEAEEKKRKEQEELNAMIQLLADQKAARDARYAARKQKRK